MAGRTTMADIARMADVSPAAVSFALNGRPGVSDATREKVIAIAGQVGWYPNAAARALGGSRAGSVGLVIRRSAANIGQEPFYSNFMAGLGSRFTAESTALLLQFADSENMELSTYARWCTERRVDGIVLLDLRINDPRPQAITEMGVPFVVLGNANYAKGYPSFGIDDATITYNLVGRLVALGHRRLARIEDMHTMAHTAVRTSAFVRACALNNLPTPVLLEGDASTASGRAQTRHLLDSNRRPTAILYDNDVMAVAGLHTALEMGVTVPDELSLIAWDDSILCEATSPQLAALRYSVYDLGQSVADMLLNLIDDGRRPVPHLEDPVLIERRSLGPKLK
ncbi:LacI family DNA-binding transcriptional regulator [Humibacter albus]|uniref:LacI family DNA-binding transcriptional regulator n=1 Tax=Humibacter albus TaxID=427754 RepID=UPI0003B44531|nr:LacI family DNA-binding transcriptional regulator [Humibacter albus]